MSLTYDLTKIKDSKQVCFDEDGKPRHVTQCIIFTTIVVDIGEITETTAKEFYERVKISDAVLEIPLGERFTLEDVQRHVGLRTNVFPKKSRAQFLTKMRSIALEKALERDALERDGVRPMLAPLCTAARKVVAVWNDIAVERAHVMEKRGHGPWQRMTEAMTALTEAVEGKPSPVEVADVRA